MRIIPEKNRSEYLYTIDWFKTRPCTRAAGLGTKFPFDETKMIEALSDSTIYMAYYTIAHLLASFKPEKSTTPLFDYVLLGKGEGDERAKSLRRASFTGIPSIPGTAPATLSGTTYRSSYSTMRGFWRGCIGRSR